MEPEKYKHIIENSFVLQGIAPSDFPGAFEVQAVVMYAQLHMPYGTKIPASEIVASVAIDSAVSIDDYLQESGIPSYQENAPVFSKASLFFVREDYSFLVHATHLDYESFNQHSAIKRLFNWLKGNPEHYELLVASDNEESIYQVFAALLTSLDNDEMKVGLCASTIENSEYAEAFGRAFLYRIMKPDLTVK